jgi:hypothetical protein
LGSAHPGRFLACIFFKTLFVFVPAVEFPGGLSPHPDKKILAPPLVKKGRFIFLSFDLYADTVHVLNKNIFLTGIILGRNSRLQDFKTSKYFTGLHNSDFKFSENFKRLQETSWNFIELHRTSWDFMRLHGTSWDFVRLHKTSRDYLGLQWSSKDSNIS